MNYSYTTIYNFRPNEMFGMGKESVTCKGKGTLEDFIKYISHNSSLKHENNKEYIMGSDEFVEREDWTSWIGQPMFYIIDIKVDNDD